MMFSIWLWYVDCKQKLKTTGWRWRKLSHTHTEGMELYDVIWYLMIFLCLAPSYYGKSPRMQWVSEKRISSRSQQVCHWIAARRPSTKHWDKGWKLSSETAAGRASVYRWHPCDFPSSSWNRIQEYSNIFQARLPKCPPRNSISYREDCNQSFVLSKRDMVLHRAQNSFAASASNSPSTILSAFRKSCCASWSFSKASRIWLASTCLPFIAGESPCGPRTHKTKRSQHEEWS